jgi:hypothetical protein
MRWVIFFLVLCLLIVVLKYTWTSVVLVGFGLAGAFGVALAAGVLVVMPLAILNQLWRWARDSN